MDLYPKRFVYSRILDKILDKRLSIISNVSRAESLVGGACVWVRGEGACGLDTDN